MRLAVRPIEAPSNFLDNPRPYACRRRISCTTMAHVWEIETNRRKCSTTIVINAEINHPNIENRPPSSIDIPLWRECHFTGVAEQKLDEAYERTVQSSPACFQHKMAASRRAPRTPTITRASARWTMGTCMLCSVVNTCVCNCERPPRG